MSDRIETMTAEESLEALMATARMVGLLRPDEEVDEPAIVLEAISVPPERGTNDSGDDVVQLLRDLGVLDDRGYLRPDVPSARTGPRRRA